MPPACGRAREAATLNLVRQRAAGLCFLLHRVHAMSRLNQFAQSLASGYVLMGANIAFSLASIPLALHHLTRPEFGLWALTAQLAGYIALIDFGISGVSRILVDYKDRRDGREYGSVLLTLWLVSAVQGLLILGMSVGLGFGLGDLLRVPGELRVDLLWLTVGQGALLAASFLTRTFNFVLAAHQRNDISNYAQTAGFALSFAVTWVAFESGAGVFSLLFGQGAGWLLGSLCSWASCAKLGLLPTAGMWGKPTWDRFRELFDYGRDVFLFLLGAQFIHASQTILVTRLLGLDAAAVWAVCTRTFALGQQIVFRVFDYATPALAEMIVRGEIERLRHRFRSLVMLSASLAVAAGVLFAACNQSFVEVWLKGKAGWPVTNDALLALWLVLTVITRCHVGLVGQAKAFGFLRYLYLIEGLVFVILSLGFVPQGGITAMVLLSVLCTATLSLPYGLWRTMEFFQLPWKDVVVDWSRPMARLACVAVPLAVVAWLLSRGLPAPGRLVVGACVLAPATIALLFLTGLERPLRDEIAGKLRSAARATKRHAVALRTKALRRLGFLGGDWGSALPDEVQFWERALAEEGRHWLPEEFRKRMDPASEFQPELQALVNAPPGASVRVLDVGAGPLTTLGKRWPGRELKITAVDPLADRYRAMLGRLGLRPPIETTAAHGEKLREQFQGGEFDLAYSSNALDHSYDPVAAIRQMIEVVKPGGHVYLWHFANEGLAEGYTGLHQWNFDVRGGDLLVSDGRRSVSLAAEVGGAATLRCEETTAFGKRVVIAILSKAKAA